eukprot:14113202-Alexandrium_andersonii.AAC.1
MSLLRPQAGHGFAYNQLAVSASRTPACDHKLAMTLDTGAINNNSNDDDDDENNNNINNSVFAP